MHSGGTADPATDLPQLRTMQALLAEVEASPLKAHAPSWRGVGTDADQLRDHFDHAASIRSALVKIGRISGDINAVGRALAPAIAHGHRDGPSP